MSRVLVIGGHGKVAMRLLALLAERHDDVTAQIRNPDHVADVESTGVAARVLDVEALDAAGWQNAVSGFDAVVWSAGAGGGNPARTAAVDRDAAIASMDACEAAGVGRYLMVSYLGSRPDHGVDPSNSFFAYAEAKAAADEHLRASSLEWTILGPGRLTSEPPTGAIEVSPTPARDSVTRGDVAAVAAAALADPATIGRTIPFNNGPVPISAALSTLAD